MTDMDTERAEEKNVEREGEKEQEGKRAEEKSVE